jgi:enoyl-CoA hydratase/carnithine racemase
MNEIRSAISNGVMYVVMHRPERKNSLTAAMYASLCEVLDRAARDPGVKAMMISGAAGVFTAGNDLNDFVENPPKDVDAPVFRFMTRIATFPKPLVAAVEGVAIGVGTTMLLHCDLVYVADDARFSLPFVNLGLVPEAASSLLLSRVAGHQHAFERLLFGDPFTATEAFELGFVNKVLPADDVLYFAARQAELLAQLPQGSVRGTKALMKARFEPSANTDPDEVVQRIRDEADRFVQRVAGPAAREAILAFKEKRKPNFAGMD